MNVNASQTNIGDPLSVLVIGFSGGRGSLYAQCVAQREGLSFEGVVKSHREPDLRAFSPKPRVYENLTNALKARKWDVVIVSVPHSSHDSITRALIEAGVRLIIKEKPLAISSDHAKEYLKLMEGRDISIVTTTQRMIQPSFLKGLDMLPKIGKIRGFEYMYHFALPEMTSGWRANKELVIGGVLLDMGYHALDVLHLYFGPMADAGGELSYEHEMMRKQQLEDKAEIKLSFENVEGLLSVDRHSKQKQEIFRIEGSKGILEITPEEVVLYDTQKNVIERYTPQALSKHEQIHLLFDRCLMPEYVDWRQKSFNRNMDTVAAIEKIYKRTSNL